MTEIKAEIREKGDKKNPDLIPAILYGPKIKNISLIINLKEFSEVYKKAGESTLINLKIKNKPDSLVLIYDVAKDVFTGKPIHVDFYQPILTEEIEATVPLVFEGEAPAVKELGGTMIKGIQEVEVKALPQNLPHEIKVNVNALKAFEDEILIKDLKVEQGVRILREPDEIVANVAEPEKVEEELEKPIEEKVDEVEKIEKEKKEEEEKNNREKND